MDRNHNQTPHDSIEKIDPGALTNNSRVLKWLDNFWYHYKWHTIIGLFILIVLTVGLVQIIRRPSYDTMLTCAAPYRMSEEEKAAFDQLLSKVCPEDFDGNGEKKINFTMYQVYSDEEAKAEKESAEATGDEYYFNGTFYAEEYQNFIFFTQTGEGAVCIVSNYVYKTLIDTDPVRLRPMSSLYSADQLPKGVTEDGYGVILGETDFYIYHPEARVLPDDLIVCLLKPTLNSDEDTYANSEAFFRAIVEYRVQQ